jgi:hypothetical protein
MSKNSSLSKRGGELLAWGLVAGILIAGCGGGGGSSTSSTTSSTSLGDYITNSIGTFNFTGSWSTSGGNAVLNAASMVRSTANTYTITTEEVTAPAFGSWTTATPAPIYELNSSLDNWIARPSTATLVDSGDGSHATITPAGEAAFTATFTKTDLAGTPFTNNAANCLTCLGQPGNYPANAAFYTERLSVDWFSMSETVGEQVTDSSGTLLTNTTPVVGDIFCDPHQGHIFQPITPIPATGDNYNLIPSATCSPADISGALGATPVDGTVLVSIKNTGRTAVPKVLLITSSNPAYNNTFYSTNGTNVWFGTMIPAGNIFTTLENGPAINAELHLSSYPTYP